ncbi:DUF4349 domain-containing protein [Actinokineospora inagensis]|uniref:DUF4349 domain-containing protein n=1 Tax=Actinokineospora inagensis TaxID=103730 RepID=UPI00047DFE14|nr:DUF4349 domain-containing protein [Actinokineospora inagensis]
MGEPGPEAHQKLTGANGGLADIAEDTPTGQEIDAEDEVELRTGYPGSPHCSGNSHRERTGHAGRPAHGARVGGQPSERAGLVRVRALLDRATGISEIVEPEGEVTRREADLESLLKRQQTLAASTITVRISLDGAEWESLDHAAPEAHQESTGAEG